MEITERVWEEKSTTNGLADVGEFYIGQCPRRRLGDCWKECVNEEEGGNSY